MAGVVSEESGVGGSGEGIASSQRCQSGDAIVEWRSSELEENGTPSTSPLYWDSDDDDDRGPKSSELYGKYTWKIEKFSQINKRELRSNPFEVGSYKWYILIYPQGCDVCNHLSLFLCVANHDKLLPGWSHFAQFTIAVVNKDPKKSKYSDTLHRFWKKEHDWGWKKFMELSKISDGFLDAADNLIIKAQVQVIREKADRPFRCLDCQYRRELVRVYLANIEANCRKFVEERRANVVKLIEDKNTWSSFCAFWLGLDRNARHVMSREKADVILKVVVKHFFVEKEVTSTLIMDLLYSGLKALEGQNKSKKGRVKLLDADEMPAPIVRVEKDLFVLVDDVLVLLQRAATEPLPPKDEKGPQNRTKDGNCGEDFSKDSIERDERRLTELGRRTVEIFVLTHIFNHKIEVSYQEAIALKRQEELIREEEAAWLAETEQKAKRGASEKEKKSKKKQAKQKRNNRKGKEKGREEKSSVAIIDKRQEENPGSGAKESTMGEVAPTEAEKSNVMEDVSDLSDSVDRIPEAVQPDSEDRDGSPVNWDTDASEANPPTEASGSEVSAMSSVPSGTAERKSTSAMDDSSSTCSTDSLPSVVMNGHYPNYQYEKSPPSRGKHKRGKVASYGSSPSEMESRPSMNTGEPNDVTESSKSGECEMVPFVPTSQQKTNVNVQHNVKKEGEVIFFQRKNITNQLAERPLKEKAGPASLVNPPQSAPKDLSSNVQVKPDAKNSGSMLPIDDTKSSSLHSEPSTGILKPESQNTLPPKVSAKSTLPSLPVSRPSSAPLVTPGPRQSAPVVSMVQQQMTPLLARSVSASGRLGPDPTQSYVPQSYRNATVGHSLGSGSTSFTHSSSRTSHALPPMSMPVSMLSSNRVNPNAGFHVGAVSRDSLQNGSQWIEDSQRDGMRSIQSDPSPSFQNFKLVDQSVCVLTDEFPHLDIINDLLEDEQCIGKVPGGSVGSSRTVFHHAQLSRQFSLPSETATGDLNSFSSSSSCRFERTMSYNDGAFQQAYWPPTSNFDTPREYFPQAGHLPYANRHIANQWQISGTNLPVMVNGEGDGLNYLGPEFSHLTSTGVNGYNTVFRPSNRH